MNGLDADDLGSNPEARRRGVSRLSDRRLAARLADHARRLRRFDLTPLAEVVGIPHAEVVASPFAARMCAMAAEVGATSRPRELRRLIDWADSIDPAVRDPDHDVWDRGALRTGKYQAFTAEAPMAVYDPSYDSKWGPHELLHRAVGFFFRPDQTRFELYIGARLNELLPVTSFYGIEQAMRLDELGFDRRTAARRPQASLDHARWRVEDHSALDRRAAMAAHVFREGLDHFERELSAIDEEMRTGRPVRTQHPFLDTSSDAMAYTVGHHRRLGQAAVGRVLAADAHADLGEYRDHIVCCADRLLFGALDPSPRPDLTRRREARDLLLRAAHLGEGVEVDLEPLFDGHDPDTLRERLPQQLGVEEAELVLADGSSEGAALGQLAEGLQQVFPQTMARSPGLAAIFAADGGALQRGPLVDRFARLLTLERHERTLAEGPSELARLEVAIARAVRDDAVERLSVPVESLPEDLSAGVLMPHRFAERLDLSRDVLAVHALNDPQAPVEQLQNTLLVFGFMDAVSVVSVPAEIADRLGQGVAFPAQLIAPERAGELLLAGAVGWRAR